MAGKEGWLAGMGCFPLSNTHRKKNAKKEKKKTSLQQFDSKQISFGEIFKDLFLHVINFGTYLNLA